MTTGGTDVLLCFNKMAFRLPDGQPLTISGGTDFGTLTVVNPEQPDITYHSGGGEHGGGERRGTIAPLLLRRFSGNYHRPN